MRVVASVHVQRPIVVLLNAVDLGNVYRGDDREASSTFAVSSLTAVTVRILRTTK